MYLHRLWWVAVVLMVGVITPLAAAGGGDVFGQIGFVNVGQGVGTHALVGGGASGMVGERAAVFGEVNYIPIGSASGTDFSASAKAIQAGFGVRVFLPTGKSMVKLYIPAVGGLLRISASASSGTSSASASETGGYFGFGFGSEIGKRFGLRPEFRYSRYQVSGVGVNAISVSAGIFYRFGGK